VNGGESCVLDFRREGEGHTPDSFAEHSKIPHRDSDRSIAGRLGVGASPSAGRQRHKNMDKVFLGLLQVVEIFPLHPFPVILGVLVSLGVALMHLGLLGEALDVDTSDVGEVCLCGDADGKSRRLGGGNGNTGHVEIQGGLIDGVGNRRSRKVVDSVVGDFGPRKLGNAAKCLRANWGRAREEGRLGNKREVELAPLRHKMLLLHLPFPKC